MRYLYLLLLCIFCTRSGAQLVNFEPDRLLHRSYAAKYFYLDSVRVYVSGLQDDARVAKLRALQDRAAKIGDDQLAGELTLLEIKCVPEEQVSELSENKIVDVEIKARKNNDSYLEADALQRLGDYWSQKHKAGLAFENYLAAYQIYSKFSPDEFPQKRDYIYFLAGSYYHYDDIENAIKFMEEALRTKASDNSRNNAINNTIGLGFRKLGKYDSSEWYFRRVLDAAVAKADSAWTGIAGGNIGINYFLQHRYAEAIPLLEKDIALSIATVNIRNAGRSLTVLAEVYFRQKDYAKAEQLLKQALALMEDKGWWPDYQIAEPIYVQLARIYAVNKNMPLAYLYADSALTAKDSVVAQNNVLAYAKAREKMDLVQHRLETEQLTNQRRIQELIRDGLVGAILLLTVIAILFINRQRLQQKKLEAEKKNTENELETASAQLDSFRLSMQQKNSLIEHFTAELEKVKTGGAVVVEETDSDVLTQLQHAIILTDDQWEQFRIMFEKVHKNFFVNLKQKIPDLSQAEIRFLALTKLKLSSKEMASMLGISTNAIRLYRHRIRRKLELDKEDMIEELVEKI